MKKKLTALAMVLVLGATAAIGGTLAYFRDDASAENVFVVGNIDIEIEEHKKDADGNYVKFESDKIHLYPVSDEKAHGSIEHGYNKIVRTRNVSSSQDAAYVRTIVLFEKNTTVEKPCEDGCLHGLHFAYYNGKTVDAAPDGKESIGAKTNYVGVVTVDNVAYDCVVFEASNEEALNYNVALHGLQGVWMDENLTSEQVAGWGEDGKVDILVYSQGIQKANLTYAEAMTELGTVDQALIDELTA